jgi:hypothetical protein
LILLKYLLASRTTLGTRIMVESIVGIAKKANTVSTKLIRMPREVVVPTMILRT